MAETMPGPGEDPIQVTPVVVLMQVFPRTRHGLGHQLLLKDCPAPRGGHRADARLFDSRLLGPVLTPEAATLMASFGRRQQLFAELVTGK